MDIEKFLELLEYLNGYVISIIDYDELYERVEEIKYIIEDN